jgi:hypothetical protein
LEGQAARLEQRSCGSKANHVEYKDQALQIAHYGKRAEQRKQFSKTMRTQPEALKGDIKRTLEVM